MVEFVDGVTLTLYLLQDVGPTPDQNCLALWWYSGQKFSKKYSSNSADDKNHVGEDLIDIHGTVKPV